LADQDWIGLMISKTFADQDWFRFNFIGSGLDSDWKISKSGHLWLEGDFSVVPFQGSRCCFFLTRPELAVLAGVVGFLFKICFFWLWSNFRNVCCITVFSIQEYSSSTCV